MIKFSRISTLFFFFGICLYAQTNHNITGQVIDVDTQEPMLYANVVLSNVSDSSLVAGTITNTDGKFKLENIQVYYIIEPL